MWCCWTWILLQFRLICIGPDAAWGPTQVALVVFTCLSLLRCPQTVEEHFLASWFSMTGRETGLMFSKFPTWLGNVEPYYISLLLQAWAIFIIKRVSFHLQLPPPQQQQQQQQHYLIASQSRQQGTMMTTKSYVFFFLLFFLLTPSAEYDNHHHQHPPPRHTATTQPWWVPPPGHYKDTTTMTTGRWPSHAHVRGSKTMSFLFPVLDITTLQWDGDCHATRSAQGPKVCFFLLSLDVANLRLFLILF